MSLAQCLREGALSLQDLIQMILRRAVPLVVKEDNSACIQAVRKGYSPTLRHLKRTQRISLGELHETFEEGGANDGSSGPVTLVHADTKTHKGDVFTKYMSPVSFREAVARLGVAPRSAHVVGTPVGGQGRPRPNLPPGLVSLASHRSSVEVGRRPTDGRRRNRRHTTTTTPSTPSTTPPIPTYTHNTNYNLKQRKPRQRRRRHNTQQQQQLRRLQQQPQQQLSFQ